MKCDISFDIRSSGPSQSKFSSLSQVLGKGSWGSELPLRWLWLCWTSFFVDPLPETWKLIQAFPVAFIGVTWLTTISQAHHYWLWGATLRVILHYGLPWSCTLCIWYVGIGMKIGREWRWIIMQCRREQSKS